MHKTLQRTLIASLVALSTLGGLLPAAAQAANDQQFIPLATYRVGAYASSGIPWWAGEIDYFRYINEVEGGVNGVKLVWQECETEWKTDRIIECYERYKAGQDGAPTGFFFTHSTPASYALMDRAAVDHIPLIDGAGRRSPLCGCAGGSQSLRSRHVGRIFIHGRQRHDRWCWRRC